MHAFCTILFPEGYGIVVILLKQVSGAENALAKHGQELRDLVSHLFCCELPDDQVVWS
jgi:hypothetical protein